MATVTHCLFCFEVLSAHLEKRTPLSLTEIESFYQQQQQKSKVTNGVSLNGKSTNGNGTSNGVVNGYSSYSAAASSSAPPRPLFVTWNIYKSGGKQLRGCIGTFEATPLESGLKSYALTAALDDTRFNPITRKELSHLECGVTLLTDFETANDPFDWVLGTHGLRISFVYHGRQMGATYLPNIPPEQGWTQQETLVSLMRKAGWNGRKDDWQKIQLKVVRYKGTKVSADYATYEKLMEESDMEESDGDDD